LEEGMLLKIFLYQSEHFKKHNANLCNCFIFSRHDRVISEVTLFWALLSSPNLSFNL
jgi:hypothetical protein